MKNPVKDPIRENRIHNEAIVDAYGPEEQSMSWYYYLESKLRFPFQARCCTAKAASPLRVGEIVTVRRLASEDTCARDMLVLVQYRNRKAAIPLSQLLPIAPDASTDEAIGDWHYWVSQNYCF